MGGALSERLARIESLLVPARSEAEQTGRGLLPAWRRVTRGEPRWPSTSPRLRAEASPPPHGVALCAAWEDMAVRTRITLPSAALAGCPTTQISGL